MSGPRKSLADRLAAKTTRVDGCWRWTGSKTPKGYGYIRGDARDSALLLVHRVSWMLNNGPVPEGLCVLHSCDVRDCVRPDHLFLGTNQDNSSDMVAKGRSPRGERHGAAKLTDDNVMAMLDMLHDGIKQSMISRLFGISNSVVSEIWTGKAWRHIGVRP